VKAARPETGKPEAGQPQSRTSPVVKVIGYLAAVAAWIPFGGFMTIGIAQVYDPHDPIAELAMQAAVGAWGALPITGLIVLAKPSSGTKLAFRVNALMWIASIVVLWATLPGRAG